MLPCPAVDFAKCQLVAFDLDGTLYPSGPEVGRCVLEAHKQYVQQRGLDIPTPDMQWVYDMIGADAKEFYREMLPGQPEQVVADFEKFCLEYERKAVAGFPHLYAGADRLLAALKQCGRTLVLVTNGGPSYAEYVWDATGLGQWLTARYPYAPPEFATKGERLKLAMDDWGDGKGVVMVGDRRSDGEAAQHAGALFIGAGYGYGSDGELDSADAVIDNITGLYNLLLTEQELAACTKLQQ